MWLPKPGGSKVFRCQAAGISQHSLKQKTSMFSLPFFLSPICQFPYRTLLHTYSIRREHQQDNVPSLGSSCMVSALLWPQHTSLRANEGIGPESLLLLDLAWQMPQLKPAPKHRPYTPVTQSNMQQITWPPPNLSFCIWRMRKINTSPMHFTR